MNRNRLIPTLLFLAGVAVGWSITGRHHPVQSAPQAAPSLFGSINRVSVYRPRVVGDTDYELTPISFQRGTELVMFGTEPADNAEDVVLISFNHGEAVISCKRVK